MFIYSLSLYHVIPLEWGYRDKYSKVFNRPEKALMAYLSGSMISVHVKMYMTIKPVLILSYCMTIYGGKEGGKRP